MTENKNETTKDVSTEVAEVTTTAIAKEESIKTVMKSEKIQSIIKEQMDVSESQGAEVAQFIEDNLAKVFEHGNQTAEEVEKIFELVVSGEEVKAELDDIFSTYANTDNSVVNKSLRNLDDELGQVAAPLRLVKSTLEGGSSMWRKMTNAIKGTSDSLVIQNSLNGIRGRVDNISKTLQDGKKQVEVNQAILQRLTPKIGMRIAKLKGMSSALSTIVDTQTELPNGTKEVLTSLSTQMESLAANQLSDLQKLSVLVQINVNNKLMLTTTEKKVVTKITSSILVNFVAGSESSIKEMVASVDNALDALDEDNKKQIKSLMTATEEEKLRAKKEMETSIANIEELAVDISNHKTKMVDIQNQIKDFLPEYRSRLEKAEKGIYESFDSSNEESAMILKALKAEADVFSKKHEVKEETK